MHELCVVFSIWLPAVTVLAVRLFHPVSLWIIMSKHHKTSWRCLLLHEITETVLITLLGVYMSQPWTLQDTVMSLHRLIVQIKLRAKFKDRRGLSKRDQVGAWLTPTWSPWPTWLINNAWNMFDILLLADKPCWKLEQTIKIKSTKQPFWTKCLNYLYFYVSVVILLFLVL